MADQEYKHRRVFSSTEVHNAFREYLIRTGEIHITKGSPYEFSSSLNAGPDAEGDLKFVYEYTVEEIDGDS